MRILIAAAIRRSTSSGMGKWTLEVSHALRTIGHEVATMYDDDLGRWCADPRLAVLTGAGAALVRTWHARGRWDVAVLHEPIGWLSAAFGRGTPHWTQAVAVALLLAGAWLSVRGARASAEHAPAE